MHCRSASVRRFGPNGNDWKVSRKKFRAGAPELRLQHRAALPPIGFAIIAGKIFQAWNRRSGKTDRPVQSANAREPSHASSPALPGALCPLALPGHRPVAAGPNWPPTPPTGSGRTFATGSVPTATRAATSGAATSPAARTEPYLPHRRGREPTCPLHPRQLDSALGKDSPYTGWSSSIRSSPFAGDSHTWVLGRSSLDSLSYIPTSSGLRQARPATVGATTCSSRARRCAANGSVSRKSMTASGRSNMGRYYSHASTEGRGGSMDDSRSGTFSDERWGGELPHNGHDA